MPFGLKNAGATYQRLVNKVFKQQIGRTMEVYIDDMITKSVYASDHAGHFRVAFNILRKHQMRLNLEKCAFGVTSNKFIGFMVQQPRIEAKPKPNEVLLLYLAVSEHATSSVLLREDEDGVQRPIYYTSRAMVDAEKR